jgi:hypothetical protein
MYLGAEVKKCVVPDPDNPDKVRWGMSSDTYVKRALEDLERELSQAGQHLSTRAITTLPVKYRPELDATPELDPRRASYYMSLIGILRWMVELGRVDILMAVAMMSSYMAAPRQGHLDNVLHIFAYLKKHPQSTMIFDDTEPSFDESRFTEVDWSGHYDNVSEPMPPNAPEYRGKKVSMTCFVDASHANCQVTRRSWTGVMIFVNRAPMLWYSKKQYTVESSTFTSEFVAARVATEIVEGLRWKLRMMGIEVDGPTSMFCDNESVVKNAARPDSMLKKKHCSIAYHRVREAQASKVLRVAWESTETNIADIFTKILDGPRHHRLSQMILWRNPPLAPKVPKGD